MNSKGLYKGRRYFECAVRQRDRQSKRYYADREAWNYRVTRRQLQRRMAWKRKRIAELEAELGALGVTLPDTIRTGETS